MIISSMTDTGTYSYLRTNTQNTNKTVNSDNNKLTDDELSLAKKYKDYLDFNNAFKRLMQGEKSDDINEQIVLSKQNPHQFEDVFKALGIVKIDQDSLFVDITQRPTYSLPEQGFHFNHADNSFTFGVGSNIPVGGYYLQVYENIIGVISSDYVQTSDDKTVLAKPLSVSESTSCKVNSRALDELIYGITSGNANWGNNMEMNRDILSLLGRIGIDTGKDFKINGVAFEVKDGIVQTKGYTTPKQEPMGYSYLNSLLAKAYEQHLM